MPDLTSEGVVGEDKLNLVLADGSRGWGSSVLFEAVIVVTCIIFIDPELVSEIFEDGKESLDPVKVFIKSDKAITVLVDLCKDLAQNGSSKLGKLGKFE